MIEKINSMLKEIGSDFRTEDGLTIVMHTGGMNFLKKTFNSIDECYSFVFEKYNKLIK